MAAPERKPVRVTIFHQNYTILASGDEAEVHEIAREMDELMMSIARRAGNVETARLAVLAGLHMADELRRARRELDALRARIEAKSAELSGRLGRALDGQD
ncbi:MAG: cell division protein ZapA [Acidobacteria bacterium]|nr:cell division protein ZapA [Acidobacteriota bacterium]